MESRYAHPLSLVEAAEEAAVKNGGAQITRGKGGRPRASRELLLEAMFHRLRNDGPWRDLPRHYGPWSTVHYWHSRWAREGLWQRLLAALAKKARGKVRLVDGTHIKLHQCAANPAGGQAAQAMGRTRGGRNTKLMALSDSKGRAVSLLLAEGQAYEAHHVPALLQHQPKGLRIVGDKAYDDNKLRIQLRQMGHEVCVPGKKNRKVQPYYDHKLYRTRYRIENLFCRLKRFSCIATRRDKLARNFLALACLAVIFDWLTF